MTIKGLIHAAKGNATITGVAAGALKMTDMKLQDMKMTDQVARHEIAGHENARHKIS